MKVKIPGFLICILLLITNDVIAQSQTPVNNERQVVERVQAVEKPKDISERLTAVSLSPKKLKNDRRMIVLKRDLVDYEKTFWIA